MGLGLYVYSVFFPNQLIYPPPVPRTREGYYHFKGSVEAAIRRILAYAPYSELLWLETKKPDLEQARSFARYIRAKYPGKCVPFVLIKAPPVHDPDIGGLFTT